MPNRFRNPISVLAFACLTFAATASAHAMTVMAVDLPGLIVESDTIVQGVVMHSDNVILDGNGAQLNQEQAREAHKAFKNSGMKVFTDISILVGQNFRGEVPAGKILKIRLTGGKIGQYTLAVPGMPAFRPKEEVLLFLEKTPQGLTPMGAAQGVFRVERKHETPPAVVHDLRGVAILRPAALPEHCNGLSGLAEGCEQGMVEGLPAIPDRMPLATLREHINAVLGVAPSKPETDNVNEPKLRRL